MTTLGREEIDLLRQNARSVVRELGLLNDAYFDIGVTLAERHLLIELSSGSCPTMGEIAERLLLDKSTVSRLIAKAMKKGYIQCTTDLADKRKRTLHLTELGKQTLHAFEPIAFSQTQNALLTLTEAQIQRVYEGVALYATGLKNSRLQSAPVPKKSLAPAEVFLEPFLGFTIRPFRQEDEENLYLIFQEVVNTGYQFAYESSSMQEFYRQFLSPQSNVYVCCSASNQVIGGFTIRPNFPGRSNHIANAVYMIQSSYQGQGIGTWLVNMSLEIAKNLGFKAMQFNLVFSQNTKAIKLYEKLGFKTIGTIPDAVHNPDGSYQDAVIFYRTL